MRAARRILASALAIAGLCVPASGAAAATPAWQLNLVPLPTNLEPGTTGTVGRAPWYYVLATNVGAGKTEGPVTFTASFPAGITPVAAEITGQDTDQKSPDPVCSTTEQEVICTTPGPVYPSRTTEAIIPVEVAASTAGTFAAEARVEGGGAQPASTTALTEVGAEVPPFGFLPGSGGLAALLTDEDGGASTQAASRPNQMTINLGFPTVEDRGATVSAGHPHDVITELPQGLLANPAATPVRCTEAQLLSSIGAAPACPAASQIGIVTVMTIVGAAPRFVVSSFYNMVPPPGMPAEVAFDALEVGIYVHLAGSVRSESDYGITTASNDTLARSLNPLLDVQAQVWGDPASDSHEEIRNVCRASSDTCRVPEQQTPFLTLPAACGGPLAFVARADSWEQPGVFARREAPSTDTAGTPVGVSGCNALEFEPSIASQPTTNLADSPSGLDFDLHQPQNGQKTQLGTAQLRDARVTLPAGLVANPSQAGGLAACSEAQIGYLAEDEEAGVHFSATPQSCPDAAKIGSLEVTTPLLAQYTEGGTKLATDPETGDAIPRPLHGSVFLAKPLDNPLGSLLAIYLSVEDPLSGTYAKLAGRIEADPVTGQLTTTFTENPELPLEDVRLHLFGGARGALITPPTCAAIDSEGKEEPHRTTTDLTPWSSPETSDAHPSSGFSLASAPGGPCAKSGQELPNTPTFSAGTVSPQAGAYTPFVLKLSREDGTQRLTGFDTVLPPGLTGKLAGAGECSDAALARATSRSRPEEGMLEKDNPSCPTSSRLGAVDVAAGAGPTPYYTQGTAYLAGPYKGAPLSMAVITPAIAGPFDLGTVVVRAALYVNPDTAQIHAVSDPFPTILHGIPLDLRSVAIELDRPSFTLNPTSCDPMAITGTATPVLGVPSPLSTPFQVGGCPQLPFKPKLSLTLKGKTNRTSHPKLIANLTARPGDANIARAQVKLPKAAFLDNAHIGTVCTRVQFAVKACPAGSVYGTVSAITPLLDYPLTGNVYLRSSNNQLPDLVADLNGPASQPIEIALAGKTDSVKGALRNTFEAVPDQPVSKFHLELFGGKRGLIILSAGLCKSPQASVQLEGQNGKLFDTEPTVKTSCNKVRKHHTHK